MSSNTTNNCTCNIDELCNGDEVCPRCLDMAIANTNQNIINGTAGKTVVDMQIDMKEFLITVISNPDFIRKTQLEIAALKNMRDKQFY